MPLIPDLRPRQFTVAAPIQRLADAFGLEVRSHVPVEARNPLLVATFLVDFTCVENNEGRRNLLDVLDRA